MASYSAASYKYMSRTMLLPCMASHSVIIVSPWSHTLSRPWHSWSRTLPLPWSCPHPFVRERDDYVLVQNKLDMAFHIIVLTFSLDFALHISEAKAKGPDVAFVEGSFTLPKFKRGKHSLNFK